MELELGEKCVVVTGGAHGIGRALAEAFAAEGARVVIADVHPERTQKIARRIGGLGLVLDIGRREAVAELVRRATDAFGPIHVFASNAGVGDGGSFFELGSPAIQRLVEINLLSHVWAAQEVLPGMVERGGGHLVQTISSAALITGPSAPIYTLTKHGALGFAEWVSLNYSHLGISVTCLCPNAVNTGMLGRNEDDEEVERRPVMANLGEVVEPELCASMTLDAMRVGRFLVLPHPRVGESFARKATDYDRWLEGTNRRLRNMRGEEV